MSKKHPIVAVTGSSGAGTSTVKNAFEHIFRRESINPVIVEGDSFHRYNRVEMKQKIKEAEEQGENLSHFGETGNRFDKLEELFQTYSETGTGKRRYYLHNDQEAAHHNSRLGTDVGPGEFTPWEDIEQGSDLLFYEGLHGLVKTENADPSQHVDLGVGVVPVVNLEWIQKIQRDSAERGHSPEAIVDTILRRMPDYINYITPQFSRTHINFQRVPTVDTSNPFIARDIPTPDESLVVVRFREPDMLEKYGMDFPYLLNMIPNSFMSRRNTLVIPAAKMGYAMELILNPIIHELIAKK